MTILEALRYGEEKIKSTLSEKTTKLHNPKLDAQVLLSHALQKSATYLISHVEDSLKPAILDTYERSIERRTRHEPVAYIIGEKEFYGRRFLVNPAVLIPRPDTEHVIDEAKQHIIDGALVFDVGTGSGAIAVTLAAETGVPVIATDIDANALAVATHNANQHSVDGKISFLQGNLLAPYFEKQIDASKEHRAVIVANLPYLRLAQEDGLDPDVRGYEPRAALYSGVDGLNLYHQLINQIKTNRDHLPESVILIFEMDPSQERLLPTLIREQFPLAHIEVLYDYANKPRITTARI